MFIPPAPTGTLNDVDMRNDNGLPASMNEFHKLVYENGSTPFFSLNVLSSDDLFQAAMLYDARKNNIPIQLMELGGEIYKQADYNEIRFPDGSDYATQSAGWMTHIRDLHDNPSRDFYFGVCAARINNFNQSERTNAWNSHMFQQFSNLGVTPDAVILHDYIGAGLKYMFSVDPCTTGGGLHSDDGHIIQSPFEPDGGNPQNYCTNDVQLIFSNAFRNFLGDQATINDPKAYHGMINEELDANNSNSEHIPSSYPVWITEYNSAENYGILHGSWAHGMVSALQTMLYLESNRIEKVNYYKLLGDAIYSLVFGSDKGFQYNTDKKPSPESISNANPPIITQLHTATAVGHTMGLLAKAMRNAGIAKPVSFSGTLLPRFDDFKRPGQSANEPLIYAWCFEDSAYLEKQIVILNLSEKIVHIALPSFTGPFTLLNGIHDMEQILCDPSVFLAGELSGVEQDYNPFGSAYVFEHNQVVVSGTTIDLQPYSVSRLYTHSEQQQPGNCAVTVKPLRNQVCAGSTSSLIAFGDPSSSYSWSTQSQDVILDNPIETPTGSTVSFDVDPGAGSNSVVFTVTVTDASCGTFTATTQVELFAQPVISLLDNQSNAVQSPVVICPQENIQWNATLSNSNTDYHFILINSLGEGVAESDNSNTQLSFTTDTTATYYLYAFDGTCAVEGEPIELVSPKMDLGEDLYVCENGSYLITKHQVPEDLTNLPDFSFSWSDGSTEGPFRNIAVGTASQTYTLTITYTATSGNACTLENAFTLIPVSCCTFPNGQNDFELSNAVLTDAEGISGLGTLSANGSTFTVSGKDLYIRGRLLITGNNLQLDHCHVYMSEAAEMLVDRHFVLTLESTLIDACTDKMYKGVRTEESGTFKVQHSFDDPANYASEINDAQYGLFVKPRSRIFIDDFDADNPGVINPCLIFRRNYTAMFIPPAPSGSLLNDLNLHLLNFLADGEQTALLDPYNGQSPSFASGNMSYAGLTLNDVAGVIGLSGDENTRIEFKNLNNGIIANNSTLLVTNTLFADIQPDYSYPGNNGVAIHTAGGMLLQYGLGKNNNSATFSNCRTAIITRHGSLESSKNKMENVTFGYRIDFLEIFHKAHVFNNTINAFYYGAGLHSNDYCKDIDLYNNTISVTDPGGNSNVFRTGIGVWESNFSGLNYTFRIRIRGNTIHAGENATENISLYNVRDALVSENTLDLDDAGNIGSLALYYNYRPTLACNVITGSSQSGNVFGILSLLTGDGAYSCNRTHNTAKGFYFDLDCANSLLQGNEMEDHDIGLEVGGNLCQIGQQFHTGNRWTGSYVTLGALHNDPNTAQQQPILVSTTSPYGAADHEPPNQLWDPNLWIIDPNLAITDYQCSSENNSCFEVDLQRAFTVTDSLIACGSISFENYQQQLNEIADRQLYERAALCPDSIRPHVVDSFYQANVNSNIGKLFRISQGMKCMDSLLNDYYVLISEKDSINSVLLRQIDTNNAFIRTGIDSLTLLEQNYYLRSIILSNMKSNREILQLADSILQMVADSLGDANDDITPLTDLEEYEQHVNAVFFSKVVRQMELDSSEAVLIDNLASLCILEGGIAAFKARAVRAMYNDSVIYNDFTDCLDGGLGSRKSDVQSEKQIRLKVYPNPTINQVNVVIENATEKQVELQVLNIYGGLIFQNNINNPMAVQVIPLYKVGSGLYFIKLISAGKTVDFTRFAIIR